MLKFCYLFFFAVLSNSIIAQNFCEPGTATKEMVVGDYTIQHKVSGDFISSFDGPGITMKSNDMSESMSILNSLGIWMAGVDDGNNPKMAIAQNNGKPDWYPGPLTAGGETNPETCANFNQIWEVTHQELKNHRCDFLDNFQIDNEHPAIYGWPAVGNKFFEEIHGFKLPDDNIGLAPFWDFGDEGTPDGRYDPDKGDFPGDVFFWEFRMENMQFWIINDNSGLHLNSESDPIKMEIQIFAFTARLCKDPSGSRIFYNLKSINRATEPINDLSIGLFGDIALGCPLNDMVGSIPGRSTIFAYNDPITNSSAPCSCNGIPQSCDKNIMLGLHQVRGMFNEEFLEVGMGAAVPLVDDNDFLFEYQLPSSKQEYLNLMAGKWTNGANIYEGGLGINDSFPVTTFAFNDSPDLVEGWSMCQTNFPAANKYFLTTTGQVRINPGAKNEMIFGLYFSDEVEAEECPSIAPLTQMVNETNIEHNQICEPDVTSVLKPCPLYIEPYEVVVYPNPSNGTFTIKSSRGHHFNMTLRNIFGSIIYQEKAIFEQQEFSSELQGTFLLEIISDTGERTIQKIQFL